MKDSKAGRKGKDRLRVVHRNDRAAIGRWVQGGGQALLPMLELLENAQASIDELMNEAARGVVEELLLASASKIAGDKHRGKAGGPVQWHGSQDGFIQLAERKLRLRRSRPGCARWCRSSASCSWHT